jgi:hypothetical protein
LERIKNDGYGISAGETKPLVRIQIKEVDYFIENNSESKFTGDELIGNFCKSEIFVSHCGDVVALINGTKYVVGWQAFMNNKGYSKNGESVLEGGNLRQNFKIKSDHLLGLF